MTTHIVYHGFILEPCAIMEIPRRGSKNYIKVKKVCRNGAEAEEWLNNQIKINDKDTPEKWIEYIVMPITDIIPETKEVLEKYRREHPNP
jgi:hypothetical protein